MTTATAQKIILLGAKRFVGMALQRMTRVIEDGPSE
jgi:hypothetical protein